MVRRAHPLVLPDWLPSSFEEFRELVLGIVIDWIIGGVLELIFLIVHGVYRVVHAFFETLLIIPGELRRIGGVIFDIFIGVIEAYEQTLIFLADGTGLVAPVIVVLAVSATMLVLVLGGRLAIRVII